LLHRMFAAFFRIFTKFYIILYIVFFQECFNRLILPVLLFLLYMHQSGLIDYTIG